LNASDLTNDLIISSPIGFEISEDDVNFSRQLTYVTASVNRTIYIRFAPTAQENYNGEVSFSSIGAIDKAITVIGVGKASISPTISTNPTSLNFGNVPINTTVIKSFELTGDGLNEIISLSLESPFFFRISLDGINFYVSINLIPFNGKIDQTIFVKYTPGVTGGDFNKVLISSPEFTDISVNLIGTGI
jgi:hypothetical protein